MHDQAAKVDPHAAPRAGRGHAFVDVIVGKASPNERLMCAARQSEYAWPQPNSG